MTPVGRIPLAALRDRATRTGAGIAYIIAVRPSPRLIRLVERPTIRLFLVGLAGLFVALAVRDLALALSWPRDQLEQAVLGDYRIYMDATHRWLDTGQWYQARQMQPYAIEAGDVLYPPVLLWLLVPFALLPSPLAPALWLAVPVLGVAAVIAWHRPAWWSWPLLALCFWFWRTTSQVIHGNPVIWVALAVAIGTVWKGPAALALVKPSVLPFALIHSDSKGWWIALAVLAGLSLPFLADTLEYPWIVLRSNGDMSYSIPEYPLLLMPVIAWVARRRLTATTPDPISCDPQSGTPA